MKDAISRKRRRRRSCYDRVRMGMIERRRARRANPAQSAALQLLALFSVVVRGASSPTLPPPRYTPPPMSPRHAQRLELARRLDVAPRYVDILLSQGIVPYARLFEDIRRGGVSRRDAMLELRKRVPEVSLDWLNHVELWNLWAELLQCHGVSAADEDTNVLMLKSTLSWLQGQTGTPTSAISTRRGDNTDTGMGWRP